MIPNITVLLTVYNGMPYLPQTVASVLGQCAAPESGFVFLIVNNGSTDGSAEFLRDLADSQTARNIQIRLIDLDKNIGRTPALNLGLKSIETAYTAIIDADDLALPGRLEAQERFLEANPEIALLGSNVRYIDKTGKLVGNGVFPATHAALCRRLPLYNQFAHAACMFRTGAVKGVGGYPEEFNYAQDLALWLKLFAQGYKAANLADCYAAIRVHPGQATRSEFYKQARAADELALGQMMLALPDFPAESRQLVLLRMAVTKWRQGDKTGARELFRSALKERFLPLNPLLWLRACEEARRLSLRVFRKVWRS